MIFGYTPFTGQTFGGTGVYFGNQYYRMDVQNGKFDEIKVDEDFFQYNEEKQEWSFDTVLLARFRDNLEAGNIEFNGMKIQYMRFKRRSVDSLKWDILKDYPFTKEKDIYFLEDKYVEAGETYEYGVCPVTELIEGKMVYDKITCDYEGLYLLDKNDTIRFNYNVQYGEIGTTKQQIPVETIGSRYPIIHESDVKYKHGSMTALIASDQTADAGIIDKTIERRLRKKTDSFLNDSKPKLLKDETGNFYLVKVTNVSEQNADHKALYNTTFEWIQIGDATSIQALKENGLTY